MLNKHETVRLDVEWANAVRGTDQGVELDVHVSPGASRSELGSFDPWRKRIIVKVKAPPEDGKANRELERLLGDVFGCRAEVLRGHTIRDKTVHLDCGLDEASAVLEALR
jgi:uncharacterized protein (TIGR00251 family)